VDDDDDGLHGTFLRKLSARPAGRRGRALLARDYLRLKSNRGRSR
jgi:hypothetical protein